MESSPCCNSVTGHQIATNFGTWHDSTAVVPCTNFCSDHCIVIEMRAKRNFHRIWIAREKPLVKRGPVCPTLGHTCGWHIAGWETSARQCEWKFGRASGKQAWANGILYRLYKRLTSSGECQNFFSFPACIINVEAFQLYFQPTRVICLN